LAVINDEYVGDVSVNYGDVSVNYADNNHPRYGHVNMEMTVNYGNNPQIKPSYIAIQFSMNQEMLVGTNLLQHCWKGCETYQGMIRDLHHCMARYMQIETRLRYHPIINGFRGPIEALYKNLGVRGYEHHDVKFYVEMVSKAILSIIAIYGKGAHGTNWHGDNISATGESRGNSTFYAISEYPCPAEL
jgi:hypothetical protein